MILLFTSNPSHVPGMIFLVAASPLVPTGPLRDTRGEKVIKSVFYGCKSGPLRETRGNMRKQELVNLILLIISMGPAENSYGQ